MIHTLAQWGLAAVVTACWLAATRSACDDRGKSATDRFWELQAINVAAGMATAMLIESGAFQGMI